MRLGALLLAASLLQTVGAQAGLQVVPSVVNLSGAQPSALISLITDGADSARFQVSVYAWSQSDEGEMVLAPTEEMVAFPQLFAIGPNQTRKLRVAAVTPPGQTEKCYRLVIEQLRDSRPAQPGVQLQFLTRITMPIFFAAGKTAPRVEIKAADRPDGLLGLTVENGGTGHFILRRVRVTGRDRTEATTFTAEAAGWYVLPGGRRDYVLAIDAAQCRRTTQLVAEVDYDEGKAIKKTLIFPVSACADNGTTRFLEPKARTQQDSTPGKGG